MVCQLTPIVWSALSVGVWKRHSGAFGDRNLGVGCQFSIYIAPGRQYLAFDCYIFVQSLLARGPLFWRVAVVSTRASSKLTG